MATPTPYPVWKTLLILFGVPAALVAATGLFFVARQEMTIFNARIVPATVIDARPADPRKTKRGTVVYRPAVRHRYTVEGRQLESDRLYPYREHMDIRHVEGLVAMYRPGQRVFTRVPLDDPGASFLAPRRVRIWYGLLAVGLVVLAGLAMMVRWLRRP